MKSSALAKKSGDVVQVDQEPADQVCVGIVVDVVHPGHARNESEHGVVRPGDSVEQREDRERDRGQHAVEDPEHQDRARRRRPRWRLHFDESRRNARNFAMNN